MNNIPNFPSFNLEKGKSNAGSRWEKWLGRLENLFEGMKVDDNGQKRHFYTMTLERTSMTYTMLKRTQKRTMTQ